MQNGDKKKYPRVDQLLSLRGKHALITGAGAGIGESIARRFAEAGASLTLVDINFNCLTQVKKDLTIAGIDIQVQQADLSSKKDIDQLWSLLSPNPPSILVNNAGIYPFKNFLDVDENLYRRVMETNLDAVYWMCQHMIACRKKKGGVIINVGSIEGVLPFKEDLAHYSMSKAGVTALTRALAKEHARHGFRINALIPGGIITPGTRAAAEQILKLKIGLLKSGFNFKQRLPVGRMGRPDEVARMALVLASDLASYVHGAAIPVDGGFLSA